MLHIFKRIPTSVKFVWLPLINWIYCRRPPLNMMRQCTQYTLCCSFNAPQAAQYERMTLRKLWSLTLSPLLSTSSGGTWPSCRWSSATCWPSWRPSSPAVSFRVTTSASPRQMLQSSGGAPSGTSEPKSMFCFIYFFNPGSWGPPTKWAEFEACAVKEFHFFLL